MKHKFLIYCACLISVLGFSAYADNMNAPDDVCVFEVAIKPTPHPQPIDPIIGNDWSQEDIERVARLLWSSPLRDEEEKRTLVWIVMNRLYDRNLNYKSIKEVINTKEFPWFDRKAHISETNLRIAEEEMDRAYSDACGYNIGRHVPNNAIYCRFVGMNKRLIEVSSTPHGDALEW